MSSQGASSTSDAHSSNSQSPADGASAADSPASSGATPGTPVSAATADVAMESAVGLSTKGQEVSDGFNQNLDSSSKKPDSSKNISAVQEAQQTGEEVSMLQDDGMSEWVKLRIHLYLHDFKLPVSAASTY